MNTAQLVKLSTEELVIQYNGLRAKAQKTPQRIRRNTMPGFGSKLQVMLDEIQKRAMNGDNKLHMLEH